MKKYIFAILTALMLFSGDAWCKTQDSPRKASFAWGASLGSNIDLSQHDMSAIGISAEFGFRWRWIRFFGVGAGGDIMVSNSNRSFPVYANFRTDFCNRPRLLFMDLRGGIALNYAENNTRTQGLYMSPGVGITLASGRTFSSHIILAYTYLGQEYCYVGDYQRRCPGVSMATLRLGVAF